MVNIKERMLVIDWLLSIFEVWSITCASIILFNLKTLNIASVYFLQILSIPIILSLVYIKKKKMIYGMVSVKFLTECVYSMIIIIENIEFGYFFLTIAILILILKFIRTKNMDDEEILLGQQNKGTDKVIPEIVKLEESDIN